MLAGFEQPDEGYIRISGAYVQGVPPHKRDVNTVFQNYALFPHMTVAENVAYGLRQKGVDKGETTRRVGESLADGEDDAARSPQASPALRAASSNASPSPARSSTSRRCSCSTSHSARSTASSGKRCRSS